MGTNPLALMGLALVSEHVMEKGSSSSRTGGGGTYRRSWRVASSWAPHLSRAGGPVPFKLPLGLHLPVYLTPRLHACRAAAAIAAAAACCQDRGRQKSQKAFLLFFFPLSLFKPGENESAATLLVQNK